MTRVFVSGCYDILHAGHIEFFKAARAFGDHLTVCFASDEVYRAWKGREPAMPEAARRAILEELRCVDLVVMSHGRGGSPEFDFSVRFREIRPDVLVCTADDMYVVQKRRFCELLKCRFMAIPKPTTFRISTTAIRERLAVK